MKPLSPRRRRLYLIALFALFCAVVPAAFLYAAGWRYKPGFGIVRTGGIFVSVPYSGATISLDGAVVGESGFLNHRLYLSDLAPSAYTVRVEEQGYRTWDKTLIVEPSLVTDAQALLIPTSTPALRLTLSPAATGTEQISAGQLTGIRATFNESFASSSVDSLVEGSMAVSVEHGDVLVRWLGTSEREPSVFCGRPSYCVDAIPVERSPETALSAAFYGGGVVYATREGGIYFSEVDMRPSVSSAALFPHAGATFRIVQGQIIIKYNGSYYHLTGI